VGGGSAIDTAKGVNIVITEETDDLLKYMGVNQLKKPMKPLIVIPTTAGTGSEVTYVAVIADPERNVKMLFPSTRLIPKIAVLDPRMTQTMPPHITAATGMDAMSHAVEAYSCLQKNPLSDAYAFAAIKLIIEYLPTAVKKGKNNEARMAMANASLMAGVAFSNSMVGIVHSIGHSCGAIGHVPHGIAMAILLPYGMEYNLEKASDFYSELLLPLGGVDKYAKTPDYKKAQQSIDIIKRLNVELNKLSKMPITLKDAGIKKEDLEKIAETAINDGSLIINPVEADFNDVLAILNDAYDW